jgi:hypothetical protein
MVACVLGCSASADGTLDEQPGHALASAVAGKPNKHRARHFRFIEEPTRLPADTSLEGTSTTDVDLVDLDGDGDLDLYVTEGTASAAGRPDRLYINDGEGVFSDHTSTRLAAVNNTTNSVKTAFGDVDGDGDLDALVANLGQEQLLLNDGSGVFTEAAPGRIPAAPFDPRAGVLDVSAEATFADVNGDGALDALIANENPFLPGPDQGTQNRLYLNDGSGWFVEAPLPPATDQSAAQLTGDIDADGDIDIVVLNRGQERILIGDGSGSFSDQTSARIPLVDPSLLNASSARGGGLADLDGDGDLDLIVGNSRGQAVEYYENDGQGRFEPARFPYVPAEADTVSGLVLADLDQDGDLDVYLPDAGQFEGGPGGHGFFGAADHYFRNNRRGKFKDHTSRHFELPTDPTTAAVFGDIDGDGDLDLVVGNTDDNVPGDTGGERVYVQRTRFGRVWR